MNFSEKFVEYYDEAFPILDSQRKFFFELAKNFHAPAKILRIECGTGAFEYELAKSGFDVTAIDDNQFLLGSAARKYRTQLMAIRYFLMSAQESAKFLGKNFYDIVICLNDEIATLGEKNAIQQFLLDCKSFCSAHGVLTILLHNFLKFKEEPICPLPQTSSIRSTFFPSIFTQNGEKFLELKIKDGTEQIFPVLKNQKIYPLKKDELEEMAKIAGFEEINFYAGFEKTAFTPESDFLFAVLTSKKIENQKKL